MWEFHGPTPRPPSAPVLFWTGVTPASSYPGPGEGGTGCWHLCPVWGQPLAPASGSPSCPGSPGTRGTRCPYGCQPLALCLLPTLPPALTPVSAGPVPPPAQSPWGLSKGAVRAHWPTPWRAGGGILGGSLQPDLRARVARVRVQVARETGRLRPRVLSPTPAGGSAGPETLAAWGGSFEFCAPSTSDRPPWHGSAPPPLPGGGPGSNRQLRSEFGSQAAIAVAWAPADWHPPSGGPPLTWTCGVQLDSGVNHSDFAVRVVVGPCLRIVLSAQLSSYPHLAAPQSSGV